jgi:hypothetical protein
MRGRLLILAALAASGCDKGAPAPAEKKAEAPAAPAADPVADFTRDALPKVNAARPSGATVEFEARSLDEGKIVAAVPKGWKEGVIPGSFGPNQADDLGFMTKYGASTNCDGACQPKDWAAVAEKVSLAQFRDASKFDLVEEQPLTAPAGKLLVARAKDGNTTYVAAARWKDGAEKYYMCNATLDGAKAAALLPAFKAACASNDIPFLK